VCTSSLIFEFLYSFSPAFHSALKLDPILGSLSFLLSAPFHKEGTLENLSYEREGYRCKSALPFLHGGSLEITLAVPLIISG